MGRFSFLFGRVVCLLALFFASSLAFSLQNYRAVYEVKVRGISAGKMHQEVLLTDVTYRIDAKTYPSWAATMLGFSDVYEMVQGLRQGDRLLPERYQRTMTGNEEYALRYRFLPSTNQVEVFADGEENVFDYAPENVPLDSLSMVLQSLIYLEKGDMPQEVSLLLEEKLQDYQIEKLADENWNLKNGTIATVQVFQQVRGDRQTKFYFASAPFRLLRMEQLRKGERRFSLDLIDYKLLK